MISHNAALIKAETEYGQYLSQQLAHPSRVEQDFQIAIDKIKRLKTEIPKNKKRNKTK